MAFFKVLFGEALFRGPILVRLFLRSLNGKLYFLGPSTGNSILRSFFRKLYFEGHFLERLSLGPLMGRSI
ncbi:hypothetical protein BpHYR1_025201 [Brachionus plicatilis]|uniref:Uncharacterized protein n=1 Tax=Brachionus plicatilis TaxID=10195 RepID=A0A3M7SI30_BRAPC|nr:hypothetical protein BpHYR1_025201 [Brachionus plicatilis]